MSGSRARGRDVRADSRRPTAAASEPPRTRRPVRPALLVWIVQADGTVTARDDRRRAARRDRIVARPCAPSIDGDARCGSPARRSDRPDRLRGRRPDARAGRRRAGHDPARELLIAPVLLRLVFLGAVAIGRRVAAPIERARQRQLEFTADASHELRTPLSVIEAQTSLALAPDRRPTGTRRPSSAWTARASGCGGLVEDLLWLARFDAAQARPVAEPVDLGVLAAGGGPVRGWWPRPGAAPRVAAAGTASSWRPPDWLDRLLGVLAGQRLQVSPQGGTVDVTVDRRRRARPR